MKTLISVKRVVGDNVEIRAKADGSSAELGNVKMSMSPFDAIAVEERASSRNQALAILGLLSTVHRWTKYVGPKPEAIARSVANLF